MGTTRVMAWALMLCPIATSAVARDPVICNFGNTGMFQTKEQYRVWLLHQRSEEFRLFDGNCDGVMQKNEHAQYVAWLKADVDQDVHLFEQRQRAGVGTPTPDQ